MKQQTFLLVIIFALFQGLLTSCGKDDDATKSILSGTEWGDDSGAWLFSFGAGKTAALAYTIQMDIPRTLRYNIPYRVEGDNLFFDDLKAGAHGKEITLIKDFKGKISGDRIVCDFKTPSTKSKDGKMPDLSKPVQTNVVLKKRR